MQYIERGPNIPDELLKAHEEGKVVFFCGSGISCPAGLPNFENLVERLREELKYKPTGNKPLDRQIQELDEKIEGGKERVRECIFQILTKDNPKPTNTHNALIKLSKVNSKDKEEYRMVTTNCDRLFREAMGEKICPVHIGPALPVPEKSSWNSLVYLHGLLPNDKDESTALHNLVFSSGDFGRAYLIDRWASRFVAEMFRNFHVCFVGYSLSDPVFRYIIDALSAETGEGSERHEPAYIFLPSDESESLEESKFLKIIEYDKGENNNHDLLHETLIEWAARFESGINGKLYPINNYALLEPKNKTPNSQVLYALKDKSGIPAKTFANLGLPPSEGLESDRVIYFKRPPFEWLQRIEEDSELNYTIDVLVCKECNEFANLDKITFHLARWLSRHMDDLRLIKWIADKGGHLNWRFRDILSKKLKDEAKEQMSSELRKLWQVVLSRQLLVAHDPVEGVFLERFIADSEEKLPAPLRQRLLEYLTPKIQLGWRGSTNLKVIPELTLANYEGAEHLLPLLCSNKPTLASMMREFSNLLRRGVELLAHLDQGLSLYIETPSIEEHPQNERRRKWYKWPLLVYLLRDAWLANVESDPSNARSEALYWLEQTDLIFIRLGLFAAKHEGVFTPTECVDILLKEDARWLWNDQTKREVCRLLAALGGKLETKDFKRLQEVIISGPSRDLLPADMEEEVLASRIQHESVLRLLRLRASGTALSEESKATIENYNDKHGRLPEDEKYEFSYFMEVRDGKPKGKPLPLVRRQLMEALRQNPEESAWEDDGWEDICLNNYPRAATALLALAKEGCWPAGRWRQALNNWQNMQKVFRSIWRRVGPSLLKMPREEFNNVFHDFSSWLKEVAQQIIKAPQEINIHEQVFLGLINRIFDEPEEAEDFSDWKEKDPLSIAINHRVGRATEAACIWFLRRTYMPGEGLPGSGSSRFDGRIEGFVSGYCRKSSVKAGRTQRKRLDAKELFTKVCKTDQPHLINGRTVLAIYTVTLYQIDPNWTRNHLLPLLDWNQQSESEACAAWSGFLFGRVVHPALMSELKGLCLDTAEYHLPKLAKLEESASESYVARFAEMITATALEFREQVFKWPEFREIICKIPTKPGLERVAETMLRLFEGSGDKYRIYWRDRLQPFLENAWPKQQGSTSEWISDQLARICILAREEMPEAYELVKYHLMPHKYFAFLFKDIREMKTHEGKAVAQLHPKTTLDLLYKTASKEMPITNEQSGSLKDCLKEIVDSDSSLGRDPRYQHLLTFLPSNEG